MNSQIHNIYLNERPYSKVSQHCIYEEVIQKSMVGIDNGI